MTGNDPDLERDDDVYDDVGRLVRMAGRRPAPPPERADRVKAAVRTEWLAAVRRRRRRRIGWGVAALTAAASVLIFASLERGKGRPAAGPPLVQTAVAPAWVGGGSPAPPVALQEGDRIAFGTRVITGDEGRVELRLEGGGSLRIDAASRLLAFDAGTFVLEEGAIYVDSGSLGLAGGPSIRTPFGTVREIGTQYEVRLIDEGLRVRVREGSVSLDDGETVHQVPAASELTVDAGGTIVIDRTPIHGPDWDWIVRIGRLPDFSGRSAREFLQYVARERGWTLRFADAETERAAGSTRLSGSFDRLEPGVALDAVLPTCGMVWKENQGTLVVSLAAAGR